MAKEININEWIENFDNGKYDALDVRTQCDAGWYDWFCRDSSLAGKTKRLGAKVKQIAKSAKVDCEKCYVWFKNNCPCCGPLYDEFKIADIETGDVVYAVVPKSGHTLKAEVWGCENGFKEPLVEGTWKDVREFFGV